MVRSTFFGLEIGKTGLTTAQFGLDVTGHNISNLDTDGYTRQRIVSTAYDPFSTIGRFAPVGQGLVGGGVRVQILDQIRSAYLDRRFRDEVSTHAFWDQRAQSMSYIESFFDNVNEKTSINYSLAEFFKSMKVIGEDPVAGAPRTLMQTAAMDLVQQLNMTYEGLIDFQKVENRAIETKTNDMNRMAKDLAELNVAIYTFEITGMIANDLRDKRNLMIDELAKYIDVEYEEYPDKFGHSMMRLRVGGDTIVDHDWPKSDVFGLAYVPNVLEGEERVAIPYWLNRVDNDPDSPTYFDPLDPEHTMESLRSVILNISDVNGGELKAHFSMRDGLGGGVDTSNRGVPYYIEMINNLARALVQEINAQHIQGYSDHPEGSETNIHFFAILDSLNNPVDIGEIGPPNADGVKSYNLSNDELKQITARNLTLSKKIQDSAYNIAASSVEIGRPANDGDPEELQRGNNKNMNALYDLFRKTGITVFTDDPLNNYTRADIGSFDEYCTTIRFDVGNTLHTAKQSAETSRILKHAANNQRTAIAGVSLDEEMVGLVKYNHAYNGAARVITQMDDALDRLINGTGRVGL